MHRARVCLELYRIRVPPETYLARVYQEVFRARVQEVYKVLAKEVWLEYQAEMKWFYFNNSNNSHNSSNNSNNSRSNHHHQHLNNSLSSWSGVMVAAAQVLVAIPRRRRWHLLRQSSWPQACRLHCWLEHPPGARQAAHPSYGRPERDVVCQWPAVSICLIILAVVGRPD